MKYLVTGSAGFIGSHLVDALLRKGNEVVGVDDLSSGNNLNGGVKFYHQSTNGRIEDIFEDEKPDFCFHLAANTNVPLSVKDPLFDFKSLSGGLKVIDSCFEWGVPMLYVSSSFVYGNGKLPTKESEPFKVSAPYGITKNTMENYLKFYGSLGFPYTVVRPATVYGPRQVKGAMADYIRKLREGARGIIYGDKTRDYVYVSDVVDALLFLADTPGTYNIGTGVETSLDDLYGKLSLILRKPNNPILAEGRSGEVERQCLDCTKLRKLGWKPKVSLDEGLSFI